MSHRATKWAARSRGIKGARRCLLNVLAQAADTQGRVIKTELWLAEKSELSIRTVHDALTFLISAGVIRKERQRSAKGRQAPSLFTLLISENPDCKNCTLEIDGQTAKTALWPDCNPPGSGNVEKLDQPRARSNTHARPVRYNYINNPERSSSGTPSNSSQDEGDISLGETNIIVLARMAGR